MQTIEELVEFVKLQIEVSDSEGTGKGVVLSVWSKDREAALEMWCYQLSKYVKEHKGVLKWIKTPFLEDITFMEQELGKPYFKRHRLFGVDAPFVIEDA